ncbi:MAG: sugar phosphate isomerase/epimerase [Clostridia bacterium]|nr:sugar phosphate isomerase/epimerase [Clostridia bacterium]
MKKHVSFQTGYQGELSDRARLDYMQEVGFDGVFFMYDGSDRLREVVEYAQSIGLEVNMIHLPFYDVNSLWLEGPEGDAFVDKVIEGLRFAARYHIRTGVCHLSSSLTPPEPCELGLERMERIHRAAKELGVLLCVENTRHYHFLRYFFDHYPAIDEIGFCFDFGHVNCFTHDVHDPHWSRYIEQLACVHMHDNDGEYDLHAMPMEGNLDWNYLMPLVFRDHPDVPMTLEFIHSTHHDKGMSEKAFIDRAYRRLVWLESLIHE